MEVEPLDPLYVQQRLAQPPFVAVDGVINVRDLGSYPTRDPALVTKPRLLLRAGDISKISPQGVQTLRDLGVRTVYDLRSVTEMERYDTPIPTIDGITVVHAPVFSTEDHSPAAMAKRFELYASGKTEAFMVLYSEILEQAGPAFSTVFRHVRDRPNEPILFHCTAGKDRTGLLAALFLELVGVPDDLIAEDYALTRVGREPAREMVMARLARLPFFASNTEAALNMFSSRAETMHALLALLRERYGGAEGYLRTHLGLTDNDLARIRANFLVPAPSSSPKDRL